MPKSRSTENATFVIRVTPGASRRKISVMADGRLKISVTAPPEKGRANEEVIECLAEKLGIAPSRVRIVSGHSSRDKRVSIDDWSSDKVKRILGSSD